MVKASTRLVGRFEVQETSSRESAGWVSEIRVQAWLGALKVIRESFLHLPSSCQAPGSPGSPGWVLQPLRFFSHHPMAFSHPGPLFSSCKNTGRMRTGPPYSSMSSPLVTKSPVTSWPAKVPFPGAAVTTRTCSGRGARRIPRWCCPLPLCLHLFPPTGPGSNW